MSSLPFTDVKDLEWNAAAHLQTRIERQESFRRDFTQKQFLPGDRIPEGKARLLPVPASVLEQHKSLNCAPSSHGYRRTIFRLSEEEPGDRRDICLGLGQDPMGARKGPTAHLIEEGRSSACDAWARESESAARRFNRMITREW